KKRINFERKAIRIWNWVFPTVLIALSPLIAQHVLLIINSSGDYHLYDVLAYKGQIVLVGVALLGESMTELVSRKIPTWQKKGIQALCTAYILIASIVYANLSVSDRCIDVSPDNIALIKECADMADKSMVLFAVGIVLSLSCKLIGRS
ncbi:MAG: hypothetical protein AAFR58_04470, partial [Cyanobacteria bacterium J06627_28]